MHRWNDLRAVAPRGLWPRLGICDVGSPSLCGCLVPMKIALAVALTTLTCAEFAEAQVTAPPPWAELPQSPYDHTAVAPPSAVGPTATTPAVEQSSPMPPAEPFARLTVGLNFRQLDLAQILGGDLGLSFGRKFRVEGGFTAGSTLSGRAFYSGRVGVGYIAPVGAFHLGLGSDLDLLAVQRVTEDSLMLALAVEFYVVALVDVIRWDDGTVFLGLRASVELFAQDDTDLPSPVQAVGTFTFQAGIGFGG